MKTKLTPEIQEKIIGYIKAGNYIATACKAVGIYKSTYYRWVQRGTKALWLEKNGGKVPKSEKIYCDFCNSVQQANAIGELEIFSEVRSQVRKDWRAGMEILARKYPQRWARRDKLEVKTKKTVESKQFIEISKKIELLLPEQRKQLIAFAIKAEKDLSDRQFARGQIGLKLAEQATRLEARATGRGRPEMEP